MPDDYSSERGKPSVPRCGKSGISLLFNGTSLSLQGAGTPLQYSATSGAPGRFAPIPAGEYWIQPDELWHCNAIRKLSFWLSGTSCDSSGWGQFRITIHPFPSTNTGGRGGFFIHGGNHVGSAGCINLGLGVSQFVQDLRAALNGNESCYIPLTVVK